MFQWLARLFALQPRCPMIADDGTRPEAKGQTVAGVENSSVSWPFPPPAGAQTLTFRGSGNATTRTFSLDYDAALRIVAEGGPLKLRIMRSDGTFETFVGDATELRIKVGEYTLAAIREGGTYSIVIESSARWGVTVVYQ
jgi:hypothetical protein